MAYKKTDKLIKYNNEYNKGAYDRISLMLPKGKKEVIQAAAQASADGVSVNAYIKKAIDAMLASAGSGFGFRSGENTWSGTSRIFSHTDLEKISAVLQDGQTIDEYIRTAVLDRVRTDSEK